MQAKFIVAGAVAALVGLAGCASSGGYQADNPARSSSIQNPRDMGQMSTQGTSQGESGTPHRMGPATAAPAVQGSGTTSGSSVSPRDMGQMGSQGTSQGETGTPHRMGPAAAAPAGGSDAASGPSVSPRDMGQMGSQGTSQGETGTPHRH